MWTNDATTTDDADNHDADEPRPQRIQGRKAALVGLTGLVLVVAVSAAIALTGPESPSVATDTPEASNDQRGLRNNTTTTTTPAPSTTAAPEPIATPPPPPAPTPPPVPAAATDNGGAISDPYSYATWDTLAQCESSGDWSINTGNGFYGGVQFTLSSWQAAGGTGYPHQASRETQITMAMRLWELQGWGAWPACTARLGWR